MRVPSNNWRKLTNIGLPVSNISRDLDGHLIEVGEDMKMVVRRFLNTGMTMEEVSERMNVPIGDLERLLNS